MSTHHSADARTAFLATYIARYANPRAGMRFTSGTACSPKSRERNSDKGKEGFGARGRTIYNAGRREGKEKNGVLRELERIDEDEERRRRRGEQFLMAARGDFESDEGSTSFENLNVAMTDELFALYIHI